MPRSERKKIGGSSVLGVEYKGRKILFESGGIVVKDRSMVMTTAPSMREAFAYIDTLDDWDLDFDFDFEILAFTDESEFDDAEE